MKVFILAIDGLEYNLVKRWCLRGLQQTIYGWLDVSNFKHLLTPIIWASFITGVPPEVHGIKSWWTVSSNSFFDSFFHWVRRKFPILQNMSQWKLRKLLKSIGLNVTPPQVNYLRRKGLLTIFDYASNPIIIDVPSYNESPETRARYSYAMDGGVEAYEEELWKVHEERVRRIMNVLNSKWDLLMAWIDIGDQMGHIYFDNRLKMLKAYTRLDTLAQRIKRKLKNDILFLIVSDHGMELSSDGYPEHSNRAFYSFNKKIRWRPQSILDYSDFIKSLLNSDKR